MSTDIWWRDFCGNRSKYDAFWSYELTLNTSNPDLTACFQNTVLVWVPCFLLWVAALFYIPFLLTKKTKHGITDTSILNLIKTIMGLGLMITIILQLYWTVESGSHVPVEIVAYCIKLITMVCMTCIIRLEYIKGVHTSAITFLFWLFLLLFEILPVRSHSLQAINESPEMRITYYIYFSLVCAQFVCTLKADLNALRHTKKRMSFFSSVYSSSSGERQRLLSTQSIDEYTPVKPNPVLKQPSWAKISFLWITKDLLGGFRKSVTFEDCYDIKPDEKCDRILPIFQKEYSDNDNKYTPRSTAYTFWCIFRAGGWLVLVGIAIELIGVHVTVFQPQLLKLLLQYVEASDSYTWKGIFLAASLFITSLIHSFSLHNFLYFGWLAGMRVRTVINSVVYRKALRLSGAAKKTTTVGEIVNLMSLDAQRVQDIFTYGNLLWEVPITTAWCVYFLYDTIGVSSFAGLAILLILMPLNGIFLANQVRKLQVTQMKAKDSRIKSMSEVLSGMKILKLYAWESSFMNKLLATREEELQSIKKVNIVSAVTNIGWNLCPFLISLSIFLVYTLMSPDNVLTADKAFVTMSYINVFNYPLSMLPLAVNFSGQGFVAIQRITRYLNMDELTEDYVEKHFSIKEAVKIEDGTFSWGKGDKQVLHNINLSVYPGQLIGIVGNVGAGKSSLISSLLGEMNKISGTVKMNGSMAFVPQQAWIQNETVRNNILFGKNYINRRYQSVLDACALKPDLHILPGEDLTEIGEKGINLSGGQKQRVSLARAVYQDEDIYLLDDPLSAVDAHVGKQLFDQVIGPEGMLKAKTRILVTHGITYLSQMDLIVVLKDGNISEMGEYEELMEKDGAFAEFLRNYLHEKDHSLSSDDAMDLQRQLSALSATSGTESDYERTMSTGSGSTKVRKRKGSRISSKNSQIARNPSNINTTKLIEEETSEIGQVKWSIIWIFVKAGGLAYFFLVVFSHLAFSGSQVATNLWLSEWTNDVAINGTMDQDRVHMRLGVYGGLGALQGIFIFMVLMMAAYGSVAAARNMHESLLSGIMHAPMAFFDTTPLGRIMNRFSKDMDIIDTNVQLFLRGYIFCSAPLLATIFVVSYTTPIFLVVIVPLFVFYIVVQKVYISYVGQLKRIESMRRSPIYAHFDETITGATSIRAYKKQDEFIATCDRLIDESQRPFYLILVAQRWLGVWMEILGACIVFFAAMFAVLQRDSLSAGMVGVSITYSLQVVNLMNSLIRCAAELETHMVSVERIDEYCNTEAEAPWKLPGIELAADWPSKGQVTFGNYSTRYRPGLDLVLHGTDFKVSPGEKVGIVGRTGAGKSSLALALFRIIEASEGFISIDDVTIGKLGLHDVRSNVSIIPQDPVVFSGSLRFNLDPFDQYEDDEVWRALDLAHLQGFVESLAEKLAYECGEGGEALSVGQRQLVCLARALLRKSKVLVMDEATAAVDLETDALIQNTIRTQFDDCTVLTVAHRLNTVLDYDRIMVLDKGRVVEFDTPTALLTDRTTIFHGLAREANLI